MEDLQEVLRCYSTGSSNVSSNLHSTLQLYSRSLSQIRIGMKIKRNYFFTAAFIWILFPVFSLDFIPHLFNKHLVVKLDTKFFLRENHRGWLLCTFHLFTRGHLFVVAQDLIQLCKTFCCPAWLGIQQLILPLSPTGLITQIWPIWGQERKEIHKENHHHQIEIKLHIQSSYAKHYAK